LLHELWNDHLLQSAPFFAFHTIGSFEDGDDLLLDVAAFPDTSVFETLYLENIRSREAAEFPIPPPTRFALRNVTSGASATVRDAEVVFKLPPKDNIELPTLNPAHAWARYRYAYGISRQHPHSGVSDTLLKLDMDGAAAMGDAQGKAWFENGCTPGEPIFVADPEGTAEDDGVLLSVVLDDKRARSMLVCIDAETMVEVGRAVMDT
jgi:carotenoid cleavage dioxygenase-like enzyme